MREPIWSKRLLVAGAALGAATAAHAQAQYFRVVGVPPGDVLNIREQPDAQARLVATVPFRVRRIRGFGCTTDTPTGRSWCRVKYGDAVGWTRQIYLRPEG
jgi:SH3-like domain-containing protein